MKKVQVAGLFALAGIEAIRFEALIDGYGYDPDDPRYYETLPRCAWWFVKTKVGWIKIGWRKRVINIEWSDTPILQVLTDDSVTKGLTYIHAWSEEDALKYLKLLAVEINRTLRDQQNQITRTILEQGKQE